LAAADHARSDGPRTSTPDRRALSQALDQRKFFRTLKTAGFDIEEADIGEPEVMIKFVAAATAAAVTIMQLVRSRDGTTLESVADAFEHNDPPVLAPLSAQLEGATAKQKNPYPKGTLAFAAWVSARLGGWIAYYGSPVQRSCEWASKPSAASNAALL